MEKMKRPRVLKNNPKEGYMTRDNILRRIILYFLSLLFLGLVIVHFNFFKFEL